MKRMEFFSSLFFACSLIFSLLAFGYGIESPDFTVVHSESNFEIRLYKESSWMSAPVLKEISFDKATKAGFHRLYQYIHGSNLNSSRIMITSPVLTTFIPDQHGGLQYQVRLYVSTKFNAVPPRPFPELNLQLVKLGKQCIAVRKFSGFAKNNTVINKEAEALVTDLSKLMNLQQGLLHDTNQHGYTIAQYNAPFHLTGRLNEVWMNVSSGGGLIKEGCNTSLSDQPSKASLDDHRALLWSQLGG